MFLAVEAWGLGGEAPQGSRGVWGAASPAMPDSILGNEEGRWTFIEFRGMTSSPVMVTRMG